MSTRNTFGCIFRPIDNQFCLGRLNVLQNLNRLLELHVLLLNLSLLFLCFKCKHLLFTSIHNLLVILLVDLFLHRFTKIYGCEHKEEDHDS